MLKHLGLFVVVAATLVACKTRQFGEGEADSETLAPPMTSFADEARLIWTGAETATTAVRLTRVEKTLDAVATKANGDMSQIYRTIAVLGKSAERDAQALSRTMRASLLGFMKSEQMQRESAVGLVKLSDRVRSDLSKGKIPSSELELIGKLNRQRALNLKNTVKQLSADYRTAGLSEDAVNTLVAKVVFGDELLFNSSQIAQMARLDPSRAATARSLGERMNAHGLALDMATTKDFGVSREGIVAALGDDTGEAVENLFLGTTSKPNDALALVLGQESMVATQLSKLDEAAETLQRQSGFASMKTNFACALEKSAEALVALRAGSQALRALNPFVSATKKLNSAAGAVRGGNDLASVQTALRAIR